jgi:hypothetical protein
MIKEPISFICPTRGRPNNIVRFIKSSISTCSDPSNLHLYFYVDEDDSITINNISNIKNQFPIDINFTIGERTKMSNMFNILGNQAKDGIIFWCGDDIIMETENWDIEIQNQFNKFSDKILLVYGDDCNQHEALATHFFIHKNWIKVLGYIVPDLFTGDWVDTWIMDIANKPNRRIYLSHVKTNHLHPVYGKGQMDLTYLEKYHRDSVTKPQNIFVDAKHMREDDIRKLKEFIDAKA